MAQTDELSHHLEQLLQRQLGRIRQRFFLHGMGWFVTGLALTVAIYYPIDRALHLPPAVRILLSLGIAAYLAYLLHRSVIYPLNRALTRRDVALAIETRFPELRQKLISAIQLGKTMADDPAATTSLRNQSREMIERVVADAAEHAKRIPHQQLLNPKRTVRVWIAAAGALASVIGFGASNPESVGVFLQRIFGSNATYPRETDLVIESPAPSDESSSEYRVAKTGDRTLEVTLSVGGDLPVLVRADRLVPREVELIVSGGRGLPPRITMEKRAENRFKYTFRRISGGFGFYVRGGDDDRGDREVNVVVIHPPRVRTVVAIVKAPTYTGGGTREQVGGSVEALIGSEVQFKITTTTAVQSARVKFLEAGQTLDLLPTEVVEDDGGKTTVYRGSFTVTRSDRYQVLLVGMAGLSNPHPGTYHIVATPDHPPIGRILSPLDDSLNVTLPDGIVPVRISASDDYGLTTVMITLDTGKDQEPTEIPLFEHAADAAPVKQRTLMTFVDLVKPEYKTRAVVGQSLVIQCKLADNRQPEPSSKVVGPRQVHVIGETDLLRRVSGHFRRIRENVVQNLQLMKDRHERLVDVIDEIEEGTKLDQQHAITSVEVAQGRIRSATTRIHLELMRAFNFHLFNRLETAAHAVTVLELYRTFHEAATEPRSFFPEFYRDIAKRRQDGRLGAMDKALDPILQMTTGADRIAETLAPEALGLLAKARVAETSKDAAAALNGASQRQRLMIKEFEALLTRLNTWNEFQDVITNTRSLLDQQRDVESRTKNLQGGKRK